MTEVRVNNKEHVVLEQLIGDLFVLHISSVMSRFYVIQRFLFKD
jgi:hypothetical protein